MIFGKFWRAQGFPKSSQNVKKIAKRLKKLKIKKTHVCKHNFFSNFVRFSFPKCYQNLCFFVIFSKMRISRKSCSRRGEIAILQATSFQKRSKIDAKTQSKKASKKKRLKNRFRPTWIDVLRGHMASSSPWNDVHGAQAGKVHWNDRCSPRELRST